VTLEEIGALSEEEVQKALRYAYLTDPTIAAAKDSGASDARTILILLVLLKESRQQSIDLLDRQLLIVTDHKSTFPGGVIVEEGTVEYVQLLPVPEELRIVEGLRKQIESFIGSPPAEEENPCERTWDPDPKDPGWNCDYDHTGCLWNDGHNTCGHPGESLRPLEEADEPAE